MGGRKFYISATKFRIFKSKTWSYIMIGLELGWSPEEAGCLLLWLSCSSRAPHLLFLLITHSLCVYVCIHVCICVYVCVCMSVCIHVCVYIPVCTCVYAFVCMYTCAYMCAYVCTYMFIYTPVCTYICVYVYMCMHMCNHGDFLHSCSFEHPSLSGGRLEFNSLVGKQKALFEVGVVQSGKCTLSSRRT